MEEAQRQYLLEEGEQRELRRSESCDLLKFWVRAPLLAFSCIVNTKGP